MIAALRSLVSKVLRVSILCLTEKCQVLMKALFSRALGNVNELVISTKEPEHGSAREPFERARTQQMARKRL